MFFFQITPREKRMYQLKDKTLEKRVKGHLIMTLDVIYNPIKAAIRTINPREPKVLYEPPKFKRQVGITISDHLYYDICLRSGIIWPNT